MLTKQEIFRSKGYNVPTYVFDADGKRIEIETSENEEQSLVYDRIVAAFVNAGYFRARIKGLNPFDVIVGGMTWCLDSSSIDLDVDFLFREDLNTGQKIALTEKIVVVLPKIKCPHVIEPHQIQGLDFIHVFPVIEWLIKWSFENRQRKAKYLEAYAMNQYYKTYTDKNSDMIRRVEKARCESMNYILSQYQPRRVCKQSNRSITDLTLKIESTLAEYGMSTIRGSGGFVLEPKSIKEFNASDRDTVISGCAGEEYSQEKLNFENAEKLLSADFHVINTERKIRQLKSELENLKKEKTNLEESVQSAIQEQEDMSKKEEEKTVELESLAEEERKIVKQMQAMIRNYEKLREKEKQFKGECQVELAVK